MELSVKLKTKDDEQEFEDEVIKKVDEADLFSDCKELEDPFGSYVDRIIANSVRYNRSNKNPVNAQALHLGLRRKVELNLN